MTLTRCQECKFVFKEGNKTIYENLQEESYEIYNFDRSIEIAEIISIIRIYYKDLSNLNLIEIGCGTGILLHGLQQHGIHVYGYEPSYIASEIAKNKFRLDKVINSYFIKNEFNVEPHVFLLYDVIEHLDNANELLIRIRSTMTRKSILIIKSGNPSSLNAKLFPAKWIYFSSDQHIAFYSKKSLKIVAKGAGLDLVRFIPFKHAYGGFDLSKLFRNFIKAIIFSLLGESSKFYKKYWIDFANDHFIAVLKVKQDIPLF